MPFMAEIYGAIPLLIANSSFAIRNPEINLTDRLCNHKEDIMKTHIDRIDNIEKGYQEYRIIFTQRDLVSVDFDKFDRLLFNDIAHGEPSDTPLADILLGLHTIMSKLEKQQLKESKSL